MTDTTIDSLIRAYQTRIERLLAPILGSVEDARDAAQETWLAIWQSAARLRSASDPWPYIRRTAVRKAIDRMRSRRPEVELMDVAARETTAPAADLDTALLRLDFEERTALLLFFWEGLALKDIAAAMDVPEGTVKTWMFRGRARLKTILAKET